MRLIARLDIKGQNLIKSIQLEGLRIIGSPEEYALNYYHQGADEIIYIDTVASLYGRNHLSEIIKKSVKNIFIPITVGGGIRSVEDVKLLLRSGADKIAINTAAVRSPKLLSDIAMTFGSQCLVLSIEARKNDQNSWEVLIENGREKTGIDVVDWSKEAVKNGVGEILLTSIDREGTRKGFDIDLIKTITSNVSVPVIASGGMGIPEDAVPAMKIGGAHSIAMAGMLHYNIFNISEIRSFCKAQGLQVRNYE